MAKILSFLNGFRLRTIDSDRIPQYSTATKGVEAWVDDRCVHAAMRWNESRLNEWDEPNEQA
jgi:hypothetical protein